MCSTPYYCGKNQGNTKKIQWPRNDKGSPKGAWNSAPAKLVITSLGWLHGTDLSVVSNA